MVSPPYITRIFSSLPPKPVPSGPVDTARALLETPGTPDRSTAAAVTANWCRFSSGVAKLDGTEPFPGFGVTVGNREWR